MQPASVLSILALFCFSLSAQQIELIEKGGKWGFVDGKTILLDYQYDEVRDLPDNPYFLIAKADKWGVVNSRGNEIVPCVYDSIRTGPTGYFIVSLERMFGVIDADSRIVIPIECEKIDHMTESYALVRMNGRWGHMIDGDIHVPERMVFDFPERQAMSRDCEHLLDSEEIKECADAKLLNLLYTEIRYPALARENGIQGRVAIEFLVSPEGVVVDPKIIRDIGAGCGEEALRVVQTFPNFTPAQEDGENVWSRIVLPVSFKLQPVRGKPKRQ